MNSLKKVVIFGATSAIAEKTARLLVQDGASVFCIGRNEEKLFEILTDLKVRSGGNQLVEGLTADLDDTDRHPDIVEAALQALGGIDTVLVAQGSLPDQSACERDFAIAQQEIQTNAMSVISLLTVVANILEQQKAGVIAVISSVAGDRGRRSNYIYGASKGMVTIFLQGLRNRLAAAGVDVVTIKPGFVDTPMTAGFEKTGLLWSKPDKIAKDIFNAMIKGRGEVYTPAYWRWIMLVIRHIPEFLFKRMSL